MRRILLACLLVCALPAFGAGTCKVTDVTTSQNANSRVPDAFTVDVIITCTGDASTGSYPSTTIPITGASSGILNSYNLFGYYLYQVGRTPGATNPTANYTTTITDIQGFAIDLGLLTSNGAASTPQLNVIANATTNYPKVRNGNLTFAVTGNSVASAVITFDLMFISQ